MKIQVFKGNDQQWYFTIVADNGEPLATSEAHKNRVDVLDVVARYFKDWTVEAPNHY